MDNINKISSLPLRPPASRHPFLNRVGQALGAGAPLALQLFSKTGNGLPMAFTKTFDPVIQILRPVSPLAGLPLGLVLFLGAGKQASEVGALSTIAICAMLLSVMPSFVLNRLMNPVELRLKTA